MNASRVYENEYILENGIWKIFKLRYFPFWHADFDKGWQKTQPNYVPFFSQTYPDDPAGPDELTPNNMMWPDTRVSTCIARCTKSPLSSPLKSFSLIFEFSCWFCIDAV